MVHISVTTPIEKAEVTLAFRGEYDDISSQPVINQITKIIRNINGHMNSDGITSETTGDVLFIKFSLIGRNKIDVAYNLEQMVGSVNDIFQKNIYNYHFPKIVSTFSIILLPTC